MCVFMLFFLVIDVWASPCDDAIKKGNHEEALLVCEREANQNDSNQIEAWLHLVEIHHELGHDEQEAYYLAKVKNHADFITELKYQYQWNRRVGQKYYFLGDYQQAHKYLSMGLEIAQRENNLVWMTKSFNDVGLVASKKHDFATALASFKQSLTLKLKHGDGYQIGNTLNNIALVYLDLEKYQLAVDYYEQALSQYLAYSNQDSFDERVYQRISHIYEDLTKAYTLNGNNIKSQEYAEKVVQTFKLKESPQAQARALINIGKHHLGNQQYVLAKKFFDEAELIHKNNDIILDTDFYHDAALILWNTGDTETAIKNIEQGLKQAENEHDTNKTSQFYALLSQIFKPINTQKAYDYLQQYQKLRELFLKEKYDSDLSNIQYQIETQQIKHDLINEQLINAQKSARLQKLSNGVIIAVLLVLLLLVLLLMYVINRKRERTTLLQSIKHHEQQLFMMQKQNISLSQAQVSQDKTTDIKQDFKVILVSAMIDALNIWEKTTNSDHIELAEKSKVWTVSIDNGTLRTRSLDKYLDIEKIPDNPRWRNVVKTCHFILTLSALSAEDRTVLEKRLNDILEQVKSISLLAGNNK